MDKLSFFLHDQKKGATQSTRPVLLSASQDSHSKHTIDINEMDRKTANKSYVRRERLPTVWVTHPTRTLVVN